MSVNESITMDYVDNIVSFKDAAEGWKWAASTIKEAITQDRDTINKQNEGFMTMLTNSETPNDRYEDASQHIREIRDYKRGVLREVFGVVTIVSLALCGVHTVNINR